MSGRRLLWVLVRSVLRVGLILVCRVRVFGQRHVPPTGGVLLVVSHQSYLDPVLYAIGLERSLSFMARRTLFRNFAFGWLIRALNAFPVTREGLDIGAMREAVRRLQDGWCVLVFPEGTRTHDGEIGPLRPGVLAISERAKTVIVPAVVDGAFEAWPRGGWPRPATIHVGYGRPIPPTEAAALSRAQLVERLRTEMLRLRSELRERKARS